MRFTSVLTSVDQRHKFLLFLYKIKAQSVTDLITAIVAQLRQDMSELVISARDMGLMELVEGIARTLSAPAAHRLGLTRRLEPLYTV